MGLPFSRGGGHCARASSLAPAFARREQRLTQEAVNARRYLGSFRSLFMVSFSKLSRYGWTRRIPGIQVSFDRRSCLSDIRWPDSGSFILFFFLSILIRDISSRFLFPQNPAGDFGESSNDFLLLGSQGSGFIADVTDDSNNLSFR